MERGVIIALDFPNKEEALSFLDLFKGEKLFVKVGMELFYSEGNSIIKEIKKRGHKIFLDLKLCDIPNTVKNSMKVLGKLGVDIVNVHAIGTKNMMNMALQGLNEGGSETKHKVNLIAVTLLTSIGEEELHNELFIDKSLKDSVLALAKNAKEAGLSGVVCSPLEAPYIRKECGKDFILVTPGIRFSSNKKDDQKRITTPKDAKMLGSNYIVVGRPITKDKDPYSAYKRCVKEFMED